MSVVDLSSASTIFGSAAYPIVSGRGGDSDAFDDFEQVTTAAPRNQSRMLVVSGGDEDDDAVATVSATTAAEQQQQQEPAAAAPAINIQYDASRRVPATTEVDWMAKWNNGLVNNVSHSKKDDARMSTNLSSAFHIGMKWKDAKALLADPKTADQVPPRTQFGEMRVKFAPDAKQGYRIVMEPIAGDEESEATYRTFAGPYRDAVQAYMDRPEVRKHLRNNNFAPGHPVKESYETRDKTIVECRQLSMTLHHSKGDDRTLFCEILKFDAGTEQFVPAPATEILPGAVVTGEWTPEWLVPTKDGIMDQRVIRRLWILVPGETRTRNDTEKVVGVDINRMAAVAKRLNTGNGGSVATR